MGGVGPCQLEWTQFHLQPYLLSLGCPDLLQWRRWICWLSFGGLFFGLDSPVYPVFSLTGSSTRSICLVRKVCAAVGGKTLIAKNTKPLFPNLLNCKENGHVILLYILLYKLHGNLLSGSVCFHILLQPHLQKTLLSRILMDGSGCRNAFLCIYSIMMKGPGLAGTGTKAFLFLGLVECPAQKDPISFFTTVIMIDDEDRDTLFGIPLAGRGLEKLLALLFLSLILSVSPIVSPAPILGSRLLLYSATNFSPVVNQSPLGSGIVLFLFFSPRYFCLWTTENWIGGNEVQIENMVECTC